MRDSMKKIGRGVLMGMAGGLASTWVMTQLMKLQGGGESQPDESPTERVAETITEKVLHRSLHEKEMKRAGTLVHYGYGTLMGGVYGGLAAVSPKLARGLGLPFGTAAWAWGDVLMLPLLKLSKPATQVPVKQQAGMLGLHLVYGLGTELIRRAA